MMTVNRYALRFMIIIPASRLLLSDIESDYMHEPRGKVDMELFFTRIFTRTGRAVSTELSTEPTIFAARCSGCSKTTVCLSHTIKTFTTRVLIFRLLRWGECRSLVRAIRYRFVRQRGPILHSERLELPLRVL